MQQLIDDMFETMRDAKGVGLAAPQLAIDLQLFVYAAVDADRDEDQAPELKVVINPMVVPEPGELVADWEGCLSIPDLRGLVLRHPAVQVNALDRHGEKVEYQARGYEGRIIQHEFDHLNGIVFLDRMRDLRSLCFTDEWEQYLTNEDDEEGTLG
jgi:peptide deformylase